MKDDNHPSKDIKATYGKELLNKRIVVCITASVSCYKSIDLIRLLMRYGAEVFVVISKSVTKFISPDYYMWASGNYVVSELSGELEHVRLANYNRADLVIVYPSTANTISKFAHGIDDTPVLSVLSIALGAAIPIVIAPAMHEAMYHNPIIQQNIKTLEKVGIKFVKPDIKEGKAKITSPEEILSYIIDILNHLDESKNDSIYITKNLNGFVKQSIHSSAEVKDDILCDFFRSKKILITLGSTVEYIDPIRVISNNSSGKMGLSLIKNAINYGSEITVIKGNTAIELDSSHLGNPNLKMQQINTSDQMLKCVIHEISTQKYDIAILAAAVSDFKPESYSNHKISTNMGIINLKLVPTKKIINNVKNICPNIFLVGFKAEYCVDMEVLLKKSYVRLMESNADLIIANDVGMKDTNIGSDQNRILIIDKDKNYYYYPIQNKEQVAKNIFKMIYIKSCKSKNSPIKSN